MNTEYYRRGVDQSEISNALSEKVKWLFWLVDDMEISVITSESNTWFAARQEALISFPGFDAEHIEGEPLETNSDW
jgi:hypothetical protein